MLQVWIEHAKYLFRRALASRDKAKAAADKVTTGRNKAKGKDKSSSKAKAEAEAAGAASAAHLKTARGLLRRALGCLPKHKVRERARTLCHFSITIAWLVSRQRHSQHPFLLI